jgi:zinc protease
MKKMKTLKYISLVLVAGCIMNFASAQKTTKVTATDKLDRSIRPTAGAAATIQLKKPEMFTLDNGLKVFVVENHKSPNISLSIQLDIPPMLEGEKTGLSSFSGELLGTATETRTKDQINEEVDFIGASLNTSGGGVSGSCLKKHLPKFMNVFSDVLLKPVFNQEELDKIKTQTKSSLASNKTSPESMAGNLKARMVYGKNHPYGEVMMEANVDNITLEDCKKYYSDYFRPNVGYLAIIGDITLAEAKELCTKYFAGWKKGEIPKSYIPPVQGPSQTKVCFVDKPGATQTTIHITYPVDYKPGSEDAIKCAVMDDILGGSFSARLFRNLRETYRLTYGAYSDLSSDKYVGNFDANADVRTIATDSALVQFFYEINRMRNEPVSKGELQGVINNLTGKFSLALEQPSTIARFAMNIDKYDLPTDYYANYLTALSKVTIEDVQAMAKKYLKPDNAYIILVGDKEVISKDVAKYSKDGKIAYYDSYGNDFVELKKAPEGVTGWTVLDNYIKAIGGEVAMKKVTSLKIVMSATLQGMAIDQTVMKKAVKGGTPKMKSSFGSGMMVLQSSVFDGTTGYSADMQSGKKDFTPEEITEMKMDAQMFPELFYKTNGYQFNLLGIDKVDEKEAYKIEMVKPNGDKQMEWYDVATGFQVMTAVTQDGNTIETKFSDYKEYEVKKVGKLKFPNKVSAMVGPGMVLDFVAKEILVNSKMDDALFSAK